MKYKEEPKVREEHNKRRNNDLETQFKKGLEDIKHGKIRRVAQPHTHCPFL